MLVIEDKFSLALPHFSNSFKCRVIDIAFYGGAI
jgi:hypothetical protein